ncbi:hypothetical protein Bpfe_015860 [Biomphalaria pfeifferi]|uniref:RNA helicase n=1 Tax=Biomphalaria pfeifferi TaxID=112525 RepID=A0AAD8BHL0_BIOPF|nr:hypothetical protein Bpfe_015860 [Biomphalaria pfeifferi]
MSSSSFPNQTENVLSGSSGPNGEAYVMNGSRGFCYICKLELNSRQHCDQHINGSKHIKKVNDEANRTALNTRVSHDAGRPVGQDYVLTPLGGKCYLCDVVFTSQALGIQHLSGQKHKKKAESNSTPYLLPSASMHPSQVISPSLVMSPFQFSGSSLPESRVADPAPLTSALKGPNGEDYIMNGTRGYCYVCGLDLTSQEHAKSHLSGTKHKKKSGEGSGMDTSIPNGKVLMCSICKVPFSCIKNAEEHFRSEKHKKRKASQELQDYSKDPEQTRVMKLFSASSTSVKCNSSHLLGLSPDQFINCEVTTNPSCYPFSSSSGPRISPIEYQEIIDLSKAKDKAKLNEASSSEASKPTDNLTHRSSTEATMRNTATSARATPSVLTNNDTSRSIEYNLNLQSDKKLNVENFNETSEGKEELKNKNLPTETNLALSGAFQKDSSSMNLSLIDNAMQASHSAHLEPLAIKRHQMERNSIEHHQQNPTQTEAHNRNNDSAANNQDLSKCSLAEKSNNTQQTNDNSRSEESLSGIKAQPTAGEQTTHLSETVGGNDNGTNQEVLKTVHNVKLRETSINVREPAQQDFTINMCPPLGLPQGQSLRDLFFTPSQQQLENMSKTQKINRHVNSNVHEIDDININENVLHVNENINVNEDDMIVNEENMEKDLQYEMKDSVGMAETSCNDFYSENVSSTCINRSSYFSSEISDLGCINKSTDFSTLNTESSFDAVGSNMTPSFHVPVLNNVPINSNTGTQVNDAALDSVQHLTGTFSGLSISQESTASNQGNQQSFSVGQNPWANSENKEEHYYFNGSRGFCHACAIELTSYQHANQHLNGQKHQKKMQQIHFTRRLQKESRLGISTTSPVTIGHPVTQTGNETSELFFTFDGIKGMCHACSIELTSPQHARQHISGKNHIRAVERLKLTKQGIQYPKFCPVCKKGFSGTESAKQHFESSKHKNKVQLLEMGIFQSSEGEKVVVKDDKIWYMCDVCQCGMNTREQLLVHKESAKHKEMEASLRDKPVVFQSSSSPRSSELGIKENSPVGHKESRESTERTAPAYISDDDRQHLTFGNVPKINLDRASPLNYKYSSPSSQVNLNFNQENVSTVLHTPGRPILGAKFQSQLEPSSLATPVGLDLLSNNQATARSGLRDFHLSTERYRGQTNSNTASEVRNLEINAGAGFTFRGLTVSGQAPNGSSSSGSGNMDMRPHSIFSDHLTMDVPCSGGIGIIEGTHSGNANDDSDDDTPASVFSSKETHGFRKKPGKPRHSKSRTDNKNTISFEKYESNDSDDDESLETVDYNITQEIIPPETPEVSQLKPEKSTKPGFKYYCRICDKHMNTKASYQAHANGASHKYIATLQKSPVRRLEPIRKTNFPFNTSSKDLIKRALRKSKHLPRAYQFELLEKTMKGDYIVYLPTGTGKTLVAVLTMALMLDENPSRPVLFLVDKVLLVLQQAKFIMDQLMAVKLNRRSDEQGLVKREVNVMAICGGLASKSERPIWSSDIIVTTAAFCQNMLQRELIRWEDFSLIVLDEVHHCNKLHPYLKLFNSHHHTLVPESRPKILGLTASPAGKSSVLETYQMFQGLLKNLGGAKIAVVEREEEDLKGFESSAEIHAINVPLSSKEIQFRRHLLEYIILCYSRFAQMSSLKNSLTAPCSYLVDAVRYPGDRQVTTSLAERFLKDDEPLADLTGVINAASCSTKDSTQTFTFLQLHLVKLLLTLPEVGTGANFVEELDKTLSPSENVKEFEKLGLPCRELHDKVLQFAADGNKDLTMFSKLIETLRDKSFIDWKNKSCKALVLVRERKIARQLSHSLRENQLIKDNDLHVTYLVGHGSGTQDYGMDVKKQKRVLDNQDKYNIVVATSIMEEGIDFQSLQLVISMNPPTSVRALVQIRGRARRKGSHFVILCSSEEEVEKLNRLQIQEKNMQAAAKMCIEEDRKCSMQA